MRFGVREFGGLAVVEWCSLARAPHRLPTWAAFFGIPTTEGLRVDISYIQAHAHGPDSRSVLDFDDSPTVLRDKEVGGRWI
jgi:hypothetical protein